MFSSYLLMLASLLTLMLCKCALKLAGHVTLCQADDRCLTKAEYRAVEGPCSGPALSKIAYISKTFVAYLEALMVAVSYFKTTGSRNA